MVLDNAKAIRSNSKMFAAFVTRFSGQEHAIVQIYRRFGKYGINFQQEVANYETLSSGATASARKEIKRLEKAETN